MELRDTLELATTSARCAVAGVRPDHMALPTPCTEWNVRALLNHLLGTLWLGAGLLADRTPEVVMQPGGQPETDLVGDDPLAAYDRGVEKLLTAARLPSAFTAPHRTPFGEMPANMLAGFTATDIAVHGWDLARATSQQGALPETLAQHCLEFSLMAMPANGRPPSIGPEVPVPSDASVTDRLVAFLGRRP
jgi:uncharacterized protein (TIGR03086 family)